MDPTDAEINRLEEFLQLGSAGHICREDDCYNACACGFTCCEECMYGTAQPAGIEYVEAKKRLKSLLLRVANR